MLVFFIFAVILLIICFINGKIAIDLENVKIINNKKTDGDIYFLIFIFNKKILKFKISNNKINKIISKEKIDRNNISNLMSIKNINPERIEIKHIDLKINIGTGDILFTTFVVTIISTILSSILPLYIEKNLQNNFYEVIPIYTDKLEYRIAVSGIIAIKTVHIIHIIYLILKKRREGKYVRTSN